MGIIYNDFGHTRAYCPNIYCAWTSLEVAENWSGGVKVSTAFRYLFRVSSMLGSGNFGGWNKKLDKKLYMGTFGLIWASISAFLLKFIYSEKATWLIFAVNRLNWQCCLAGSSKTASRILIFLLPWVLIIQLSLFSLIPMPPIYLKSYVFS